MKLAKFVAASLLVACQSPALANPIVSYAIEPSRFDFVTTVSADGTANMPVLKGTMGTELFDVIVCNQGTNDNTGTAVGSPPTPFNVAAGECRAMGGISVLKLDVTPAKPWHGVIYGRFR